MIDKSKWVQVSFWIPKHLKKCLDSSVRKRDISAFLRTAFYKFKTQQGKCGECEKCAFDRAFKMVCGAEGKDGETF